MMYLGWNSIIFILIISPFCLIRFPKQNINYDFNEELSRIHLSSSVWCHDTLHGKRCSFHNLCYNPKYNFLFLLTPDSVLLGIKSKKELMSIGTTWMNHSNFMMKINMVKGDIGSFEMFHKQLLVFSRFKPDNLMHVIHDDLLPLYVTYKRHCLGNVTRCFSKYVLGFLDSADKTQFHVLYEAFTKSSPFFMTKLNGTVCFSSVQVGLDSSSTFYQYGFEKPQGLMKPAISGHVIQEFTEYILSFLNIKRNLYSPVCTFITRKLTRKILNEGYIMELIKGRHEREKNTSISFNQIDINTHPIEDIIASISSSTLFLGMHGAGMILAMFLPENSTCLELFPYGIIKEFVSPVYSMSTIKGIHFRYLSWTNKVKANTLWHPEYPSLLGGFQEVPHSEQIEIGNASSVPAVQCCHNPLYLHFMYQDTFIDHSSFMAVLQTFFEEHGPKVNIIVDEWYFPGPVLNTECNKEETLVYIRWKPPFNVRKTDKVMYKVSVSSSSSYLFAVTSDKPFLSLNSTFGNLHLQVWIMCIVNDVKGSDFYFECKFNS